MVGSLEKGGVKNEKPMSSDQHLYTGVFVCVCVVERERAREIIYIRILYLEGRPIH